MARQKVVLVNPPPFRRLEPEYDTPRFVRLGLAYIAGYLRHFGGCSVEIIDAKFERISFEDTIKRILASQPDVAALGAFTCEVKPAAYIARLIKKQAPHVRTVLGGVHITAIPEYTAREFPDFDLGVYGEGEVTFAELCAALRDGGRLDVIPGLIIRTPDGVVVTPNRDRIADQDSIPFPAWDLLPRADEYFLMTQRGCPFNCLYCMNPNGRTARARSIDNLMEELRMVIDRYHPRDVTFGDELFSVNMDRTHELLDRMIAEGIQHKVKWSAQTHVHFVDARLLKKMKRAGAETLGLGIETGDAEVLKKMGKGTTPDMIIKASAAAREAGLPIRTFFILGHPNETLDTMNKTVDLAVQINPKLPIFGIMVPYPGTEIGRLAATGEGGYRLRTTNWDDYDKQLGGALEFANISRQEIERIQMLAYTKVFLLNGRYLDFLRFCWRYRTEGIALLKKILFRRASKLADNPLPGAADVLNSVAPGPEVIVDATKQWQTWQKNDLARLKKAGAQASVVFVELQRNRASVATLQTKIASS